ncbi:MAG: nicotinamide riboside transporter PnuC [Legionellales bacterium]|nr:nicotinamide riboside transporter PnuC [Legionellales bacterium]
MHYIEFIAACLGFFCTWFSMRQHLLTWPTGIISVMLYAKLFQDNHLYGDMALQIVYLVLFIYGWYQWLYGGDKEQGVSIAYTPRKTVLFLLILFTVGCGFMAYLLQHFTASQMIVCDTFTTTASLIAQWLLAKKYIETWYVWFIVDATYVGMYLYKGLYITSVLNIFYTSLAALGFYWWQQHLREQHCSLQHVKHY